MAKRFSETDKWRDEWFSQLPAAQKLVFLFLIDMCDNAGFIEVNSRLNSFLIGITEEKFLGALEGLKKAVEFSKDGRKLWVKNFIVHQKNFPLNFENNAHKQIIILLQMNVDNFTYCLTKLGANQGLISPIGIGNGKGIDKGNSKDTGKFLKKASEFYLSEIENNTGHEFIQGYKDIYEVMFEGELKETFEDVLKIKNQLSFSNYLKLRNKEAQHQITIIEKLADLANSNKSKNYNSLYLTMINWMKPK